MRSVLVSCLLLVGTINCVGFAESPVDSSQPGGFVLSNALLSMLVTGPVPTTPVAACNPCRVYATADAGPFFQPTVSYTSVAGADSICNSNSLYPGTGTFKALISSNARIACTSADCTVGGNTEHVNWVLYPNKAYVRVTGGLSIGTTNANAIFTFPLTNSFDAGSNGWATGMNNNWTFAGACTDNLWGTGTAGTEPYGLPTTANTSIGAGSQTCASAVRLVCVEQ